MWNATVRALIRDLLAGLGAGLAAWQAGGSYAESVVSGLVIFVGLATAEFGTPLNPSVGVGKDGDA